MLNYQNIDQHVLFWVLQLCHGFTSLIRSKGNYIAVHLKDENLTGLHQQTAKDFIHSQLYGPGTNRTSGRQFSLGLHLDLSVLIFVINVYLITANEFFSIANKKDSVKKAAVQFVDKSWGK